MFRIAAICLSATVTFAVQHVHAQTYPTKPIRIISPYTAGGLGDLVPRAIGAGLTEALGQQILVENRPGASQAIGMQLVAKSPADGYTLVYGSVTSLAINPAVTKDLPYDPVKDFAPLSLCVTTPLFLVVHPSVPAKNVKELLALAKRQPGKLTFASGGNGSSNHLAGELLKLLAGVDLLHVPYKGAGPAMSDVMAGHVDLMLGAAGLAEETLGVRATIIFTVNLRKGLLRPLKHG